MKKVYISGAISGRNIDEVRLQFGIAEARLKKLGYKTVNPTKLCPKWFGWTLCMLIDLVALRTCDAIYLLPGWEESIGATIEFNFSKKWGCELLLN